VKPGRPESCDLACGAHHESPRVVIIEVVIPRSCSGIEAARKALLRWPGVKILLTSATPASYWPPEAQAIFAELPRSSYCFLPKPFTVRQVEAALEELGLPPSE
jgi:hypothetical protein